MRKLGEFVVQNRVGTVWADDNDVVFLGERNRDEKVKCEMLALVKCGMPKKEVNKFTKYCGEKMASSMMFVKGGIVIDSGSVEQLRNNLVTFYK